MGGQPPEIVAAALKAQLVNAALGGAFCSPWDVDALPDDDIADILAWQKKARKLARMEQSKRDG